MTTDARYTFAQQLLRHVAAGRISAKEALPVVEALCAEVAEVPLAELIEQIDQAGVQGVAALRTRLMLEDADDALSLYNRRRLKQPAKDVESRLAGYPIHAPEGWEPLARVVPLMGQLFAASDEQRFVARYADVAPGLANALTRTVQGELNAFHAARHGARIPDPLSLLSALDSPALTAEEQDTARTGIVAVHTAFAADVDRGLAAGEPLPPLLDDATAVGRAAELLHASHARPLRQRALDVLLAWPTDAAAPALLKHCADDVWMQQRTAVMLTLRFGLRHTLRWDAWSTFLTTENAKRTAAATALLKHDRARLLWLWCGAHPEALAEICPLVEKILPPADIPAGEIMTRWRWQGEAAELKALHQAVAPQGAPPLVLETPARTTSGVSLRIAEVAPTLPRPVAKPVPQPVRPPPPWRAHLKSFFSENWYLVLGLMMVVVGASLLAYYTWDKHWLVRYTVMPLMLGAFTAGLARLGGWLESREASLLGTGALLRGAAIGLLPLNFMTVALLSNDSDVSAKLIMVPAMGALYLGGFGFLLMRWSAQVHPLLRVPLGATLLAVNGLIILTALAFAAGVDGKPLHLLLTAGFYLGFALVTASSWRFAATVLNAELAADKRVSAFFGVTLLMTYGETFLWVHGFARYAPQASYYSLLVVAGGGLVLFVERRFLALVGNATRHQEVSFVGYALLMLGVLMASGHQYLRIAAMEAAGAVWIYQAFGRRHAVNYWLGLGLVFFGGASIGLVSGFPPALIPALGIALSMGMLVLKLLGDVRQHQAFRAACTGFHVTGLLATAIITMVMQWTSGSPPLVAGAHLVVIGALFTWRATVEDKLRWLHTAALTMAFALPYLGCVDVAGHSAHGNTMAFGLTVLSALWLGLVSILPGQELRKARSTVLCLYGAIALFCVVMRLVVEGDTAGDGSLLHVVLDELGPFGMVFILGLTTWYTRSWLPAVMAGVLGVVLVPAMRSTLERLIPGMGSHSGFGSALTAACLMGGAFVVRRSPRLQDLTGGDPWLGEEPFPLRRQDHTLFTIPMVLCAVLMSLRVDVRGATLLAALNIPLTTAAAVFLTGFTWTLLAAYTRAHAASVLLVHAGWVCVLASVWLAVPLSAPAQWRYSGMVLALHALWAFHTVVLAPRRTWAHGLLVQRADRVARRLTVLAGWGCAAALLTLAHSTDVDVLLGVTAAVLCWHALRSDELHYGATLFAGSFLALLAFTGGEGHGFFDRLSLGSSLAPALAYLVGFQVLHFLLELAPAAEKRVHTLTHPFQAGTSGVLLLGGLGALVLLLAGLPTGVGAAEAGMASGALALALLLAARANACGPLLLLAIMLGWEAGHLMWRPELHGSELVALLMEPLRVSAFALLLAVLPVVGKRIENWQPRMLAGPYGVPFFAVRATPGLHAFSVLNAVAAVLLAMAAGPSRTLEQLAAPFIATLAVGIIGMTRGQNMYYFLAAALLSVGNDLGVIRALQGQALADSLSQVHIAVMGLGLALVETTAIHRLIGQPRLSHATRQANLVMAGLVLFLLAGNYFVHPNLAAMDPTRFVTSGAMALLAGWYFRRAALRAEAEGIPQFQSFLAAWHAGVCIALWCGTLLIPPLRQPGGAMFALAVPSLYFYVRAELAERGDDGELTLRGHSHLSSASVLALGLTALYVLRAAFQAMLFPEAQISLEYYHSNAPVVVVLGVVMMRLKGLGASWWLGFYGGLTLLVGSFFLITAVPGFSPFDHVMVSAFVAVGLAHFWTAVVTQPSPLRTGLRNLLAVDDEDWGRLATAWRTVVMVALHLVALIALAQAGGQELLCAPLIVAVASVSIHQAALATTQPFALVATVEILLGIHAGFLVESYLPTQHIIWVLLGLWVGLLLAKQHLTTWLGFPRSGLVFFNAFLLCGAHILLLGPSSVRGLIAALLVTILGALSPSEDTTVVAQDALIPATLLLLAPAWLVFFSQIPAGSTLDAWAVIATAATLLALGFGAECLRTYALATGWPEKAEAPRVYHQALQLCARHGSLILRGTLYAVLVVSVGTLHLAPNVPFSPLTLGVLCVMLGALAAGFLREGHLAQAMVPFLLAELCLGEVFGAVRRQVLLTNPEFWTYEYDLYAEMIAAVTLAGIRELFPLQRHSSVPVLGSLFALVAGAAAYTIFNGADTNVALMVLGMHSLLFAFMGREARESPYNLIAVFGFVGFSILVLHGKLALYTIHAYVIPVGIGMLVLVQMFGRRMEAQARNNVRMIALLGMLGSAGYYALAAKGGYPLAFHAVFVVMGLVCMALGSLLRIRLYLALGFSAIAVDLAAIMTTTVGHMERGIRMTLLGVFVLLMGVGLVAGAAYFKANQQAMMRRVEALRMRFAGWE